MATRRPFRAAAFAIACALIPALSTLVPAQAAAQSTVQNDSIVEGASGITASALLVSDEMYEAVFDIPAQWLTDAGGSIQMLGVEVLMVGGCHPGGTCSDGATSCTTDADCPSFCGRWAVEVWEEPAVTMNQAQNSCFLLDSNFNYSYPDHSPPGATTIFSQSTTLPAYGFQVEGQPPNGNALLQQLLFSQLNMLPNVTINPIMLDSPRVRVGLKAMDKNCTNGGTSYTADQFPVLVADQDGISAPNRNFLYGTIPYICSSYYHFLWEDMAPAFESDPGDWVMRLIVDRDPDTGGGGGGEDAGMGGSDAGYDAGYDAGVDTGYDAGVDTGFYDTGSMPDIGDLIDTGGGGEPDGIAIDSVTPSSGPNDQSVDVVILGSGFEPGIEVLLGAESIGVTETRTTRIRATIPEGFAIGTYDIILTNPDDSSARLPMAYTVTDPAAAGFDAGQGGVANAGADAGPADSGAPGTGGGSAGASGAEDGCGCDTTRAARTNLYGVLLALVALGLALGRRGRRRARH